jgi:prepilin-type N-terminal cleavage/methylation domain-containing protein
MRSTRGFSLLEVVVATAILTIGASSLAQLATIAARANASAGSTTTAVLLAQAKMEQLRGLVWALDAQGAPIGDVTTDVSAMPAAPSGGVGLSPSPSDALARNEPGYCDFVDGAGRSLGGGAAPPAGTAYIRRWAIAPMPAFADRTLILQVLVVRARHTGADAAGQSRRLPDEARLVGAKTRKAY